MKSSLLYLLLFVAVFSSHGQSLQEKINRADTLFVTENYQESLLLRRKIISQIKDKTSETYLTQIFKQRYTEYYLAENPKSAISKIELALAAFKGLKVQSAEERIGLYSEKYHTLAYDGQWEEALQVALQSYQIHKNKTVTGKSKIDLIYDIGYIYDRLGNLFEAIRFYKLSLENYIQKFGSNNNDVALNYNNLAHVYSRALLHKNSIDCYKKAIQIWEKLPIEDNNYLITAYQNLVVETISYGDLDAAKNANIKLNTVFFNKYRVPSTDSNYLDARPMQVLSNVTLESALDNYPKALTSIDSLFSEQIQNHSKPDRAVVDVILTAYQSVADAAAFKEEFDLTIALSKKALSLAQKHDFPRFKMIFHAKLATAFKGQKRYELALHHIQQAQSNYAFEGFSSSKFSIALIQALIYDGLKQHQKASKLAEAAIKEIVLEQSKKVIPIDRVTFSDIKKLTSDRFIMIFSNAARVYLNKYHQTQSGKDLKTAENLYKLSAEMFQEYYLKGSFNDYINTLHLQITEGLLAVAMESEGNAEKTSSLINLVERNASQHLVKTFDKKLQESNPERTKLLSELNQLVQELDYYQNLKTRNATKINKLKKEISEVNNKLESKEKNYARFNASDFDVASLQSKLENDRQIVKYYVAEENVYQLLISKEALQLKKLGTVDAIKSKTSTYVNLLKSVKPDYGKASKKLYAILAKDLSGAKITIIPDGFLNYLPFETLQSELGSFLGQHKIISYDYSLSIWLLQQEKTGKPKSGIAAFSPFYGKTNSELRSDFKELKFAKQEVEAISALYNGTAFLNQAATKKAFLSNTQNFGIFHLSMHSLLFEDFKESCLVFSDHQKLYFSELYNLHIPARMMVLSACDTGNGTLVNGEGIMSLSRSLAYAGVQSSVVSLWQVPDKETSEIMILFYTFLKKGQAKDEALANAKQEFIRSNPMQSHPFYWAGFVVNGDVSPIVSSNNWLLYIGLGLVLAGLLFYFRKRLFQIRQ